MLNVDSSAARKAGKLVWGSLVNGGKRAARMGYATVERAGRPEGAGLGEAGRGAVLFKDASILQLPVQQARSQGSLPNSPKPVRDATCQVADSQG